MADLTTQVLIDIRDEIRATKDGVREELRAVKAELSARIDETNVRLGRLERRHTDAEMRVTTELVAVAGVLSEVRDALIPDTALRRMVDDHEQRIRALESTRE